MPSNAKEIAEPIAFRTVETMVERPHQIFSNTELIIFQIISPVAFMAFQPASQAIERVLKKLLRMPDHIVLSPSKIPFIVSQTPSNICLMPFQKVSQSPVNKPINTSRIPESTSTAPWSIPAIAVNTPSIIGARALQNSSQIVFSLSTHASNKGLRAVSNFLMKSYNP